jgi:hypothetical protein
MKVEVSGGGQGRGLMEWSFERSEDRSWRAKREDLVY